MKADAASLPREQMAGAGHDVQTPAQTPATGPNPATETDPVAEADPVADADSVCRVLPIVNHKGLHARASAKFVQTVEGFACDVTVSRGGETVGGQSIMGLMMLAAARGTQITVEARGHDAALAMDAIEALVASKFGEDA